jgi:RHS repeat-associated protein
LADTPTTQKPSKINDFLGRVAYYGYRYYDPITGRWPSRDPIEENGGINLHAFVGNDGVDWWEYLGLARYEYDGDGFHIHTKCDGTKLTYALKFNDDGTISLRAKNGHASEFNENKAWKHWDSVSKCPDELEKMRDVTRKVYSTMGEKAKVEITGKNLRRLKNVAKAAQKYLPVLVFVAVATLPNEAEGQIAEYLKAVESRSQDRIDIASQNITEHIQLDSQKVLLYEQLTEVGKTLFEPTCPCEDACDE